MTPGTVTIEMQGGEAVIHSLTHLQDADVTEGAMNAKVCWLEGKARTHNTSNPT